MNTLAVLVTQQGPLLPADAVGWAIRIAKRIELMHGSGRVHGNLSPESITVEGASPRGQGILLDLLRTDPSYQSPERANGGPQSALDDAWAIATTLFTLLTGRPPYQGAPDENAIKRAITTTPAPRLAQFGVMDPTLNNILLAALAPEPAQRFPTAIALRQALESWSPDPSLAQLPPLEEDEDENQPTMVRGSPLDELPASTSSRVTTAAPIPSPFGLPDQGQNQQFSTPLPAAGARPQMQIPNPDAARAAPTMRFAPDQVPAHMQPQQGFGQQQGFGGQQAQIVGQAPPAPVPSRFLAIFFAVWFVVTVAGGVLIFVVLRKLAPFAPVERLAASVILPCTEEDRVILSPSRNVRRGWGAQIVGHLSGRGGERDDEERAHRFDRQPWRAHEGPCRASGQLRLRRDDRGARARRRN